MAVILKKFLGFAAIVTAVMAIGAPPAMAQSPDGDPKAKGGEMGVASQTLVITGCGAPINSLVRTQDAFVVTTSTRFRTLTATSVTVPSGQTRCIKVNFTAETACGTSSADDLCYIRATDNGIEMDPRGGGFQTLDSESFDAAAHGYQWVRRVGSGAHTIAIQVRVLDRRTEFFLDDWTFDVQNHR